jgi:quercetin dioxygenase-like cupin family protein
MHNLPCNLKSLISYSPGGITNKVLIKTKNMNATLFCMASGTELSEHTSAREGLVFVLEGKGAFTLEGKKIPMNPGVLIRMNKNAVHSLEAEEDTSFLLVLSG